MGSVTPIKGAARIKEAVFDFFQPRLITEIMGNEPGPYSAYSLGYTHLRV